MADTSKKRTRKAKLVPRIYDLTEDEPNQLLTKAISSIEDTETPDPVVSVLPKIKNQIDNEVSYESTSQSDRFSVEIEVEQCREDANEEDVDHEENIEESSENQSFLPLPTELVARKSSKKEPLDWLHRKDAYYDPKKARHRDNFKPIIISPAVLKKELVKSMATPSEYADKQIEIEVNRNLHLFLDEPKLDFHEQRVQDVMMQWRNWASQGKNMRQSVFIYKCLPCNLGMWHLEAFREHIRRHDNIQLMLDVFTHHECAIIATSCASFESMCLLQVEDTCWRCLKTYEQHMAVKKEYFYFCIMCYDKFSTCLSLFIHEGECNRYQKRIFAKEIAHETFWKCDLCNIQCLTSTRYNEHFNKYHTVRSDLFIDPQVRKECPLCQGHYYMNITHLCPAKSFSHLCKFCPRKFQNRFFKYMHEQYTKTEIMCMVCRKYIPKECMELEHMMKHSTKYELLYRCMFCVEFVLFPSVKAVMRHQTGHVKRLSRIKGRYERVIVPKTAMVMKWPKGITPSMLDLYREDGLPTVGLDNMSSPFLNRWLKRNRRGSGNSSTKAIDSGSEDSNSQRDNDIESDAAQIRDMLFNSLQPKKKMKMDDNVYQIEHEEIHIKQEVDTEDLTQDEDYEIQGEEVEVDEILKQNVVKQECLDQDKEIEEEENELQKFLEQNIMGRKKNLPESSRSMLKDSMHSEDKTPNEEVNETELPVVKQERLSTEDESLAQAVTENEENTPNSKDVKVETSVVQAELQENQVNTPIDGENRDSNVENQEVNENNPIVKEEYEDETENAVAGLLNCDNYQDEPDYFTVSSGDDYLDEPDPISQDVLELIKKEVINDNEKSDFTEIPAMTIKEEPIDYQEEIEPEHAINIEIKRETESPPPTELLLNSPVLDSTIIITSKNNSELDSAIFQTSKRFFNPENSKRKNLLESLKIHCSEPRTADASGEEKSDDGTANVKIESDDDDDDYACDDNDADDPDFVGPDLSSSFEANETNQGMIYTCAKCGFRDKYKQFRLHKRTCKTRKSKKYKSSYPCTEISIGYPCTKCNKTFNLLKFYLEHIQTHGFKRNMCPTCYRVFPALNQMSADVNAHIRRSFLRIQVLDENKKVCTSKADGMYQCKTCKDKVEFGDFFRHWESHLDLIVKECQEPRKEISVRPEINEYSTMSPEDVKNVLKQLTTPFGRTSEAKSCIVCLRRFTRHNDVKRHLIEHLLKDAYAFFPKYKELRCQYCQEGFEKADLYKRHMRQHGEMPIFKCEICDRTFSDSSNFAKHKKVHNYKIRTCTICFKKFTSRMGIEKHMELHKTTSPIKCELCFQVFYTESAYKKHYKLKHNKDRVDRFSCKICQVRFRCLKDTWDHMWEEHKERKYKADCPLCNKSFRKYNDVRRHVEKEHYVKLMRKKKGGSSSSKQSEDRPMEIDEFIDHMAIEVNEQDVETLIVYEDGDDD